MSALDDRRRLEALERTALLDATREDAFDRLTRLVTVLLDVPVSLVSLVQPHRQFFVSCVGLCEPFATTRESALSHSFCQHCVITGSPFVVSDARRHPLVRDNLAIEDIGVVAYAGIPLMTKDGSVLGTLCAIDSKPREWRDEELALLSDIAAAVMSEIELYDLGLDYLERYPGLIAALTSEELQQAARRHLDPDRLAVGVAGPP